jgi:hypothetical protein
MTTVNSIFAGLVLLVTVLGTSQVIGPSYAKYEIKDDCIEFVLFEKFSVWRTSFEDIEDIRLISFVRLFTMPALHLMNRPFAQYVLIRRRHGVFRSAIMTPDRAGDFVEIVRRKIEKPSTPIPSLRQ